MQTTNIIKKLNTENEMELKNDLNNQINFDESFQQSQILLSDSNMTDALIKERNEEIKKIQQSIEEVNDLFQTVSQLVTNQGELINSIEDNVESAVRDTEQGCEELREANEYQKYSCTII